MTLMGIVTGMNVNYTTSLVTPGGGVGERMFHQQQNCANNEISRTQFHISGEN